MRALPASQWPTRSEITFVVASSSSSTESGGAGGAGVRKGGLASRHMGAGARGKFLWERKRELRADSADCGRGRAVGSLCRDCSKLIKRTGDRTAANSDSAVPFCSRFSQNRLCSGDCRISFCTERSTFRHPRTLCNAGRPRGCVLTLERLRARRQRLRARRQRRRRLGGPQTANDDVWGAEREGGEGEGDRASERTESREEGRGSSN